jgi:hypothetical protein
MLAMELTEMSQPPQDRRVMRRFDMRLPAIVKMTGEVPDQMLTETMNVSAKGIFFYLDRQIEQGCPLEVTLTFPPHVTLTESVKVRFTAKVVRVESPLPALRVGVAAVIEDYEFLKAINGQVPIESMH